MFRYIVGLTIAPVFFTAALYVSFMRCLPLYDPSLTLNRLRPRYYIILFVTFDFLSLVLQSIGGAIADTANTKSTQNFGVHIMVAGLAVQVVSLFAFIGLCVDFAMRVRKLMPQHQRAPMTAGWRMKGFVYCKYHCLLGDQLRLQTFKHKKLTQQSAIAIATIAIQIRSIFRCAELSGGFSGKLANDQVSFMILEGGMMIIALIAMTSFHPGFAMGDAFFVKAGKGDHSRIVNTQDPPPYEGGVPLKSRFGQA